MIKFYMHTLQKKGAKSFVSSPICSFQELFFVKGTHTTRFIHFYAEYISVEKEGLSFQNLSLSEAIETKTRVNKVLVHTTENGNAKMNREIS